MAIADSNATPGNLWRLGLLTAAAALGLHICPLLRPMILFDDFQIVLQSRSWSTAWSNLWLPANEHAMPLGRLATAAWVQLAARPTSLPRVLALQGPLALLAALPLIYCFVRRELGRPFYGLVAVIFFGVTSIYHQAVSWFAASFSVLCLDQILLALLVAQAWRKTGRTFWLLACTINCALAPTWFASGILAGPLCAVYLLLAQKDKETRRQGDREQKDNGARRQGNKETRSQVPFVSVSPYLRVWVSGFRALIPVLGTAAFLVLSLPRTAGRILHLPHYGGRTAWEAFHPLVGLLYTARSLVDNLGLGAVGISGVSCPVLLVPLGLLLWVAIFWWWRPLISPRLFWLGLAFILPSYVLTYSARALWGYDEVNMTTPTWGRYHLLPQLGLVLLVTAGLPRWQGLRFRLDPRGWLSAGQTRALALLIVFLFLMHLPRGLLGSPGYEPAQQAVLARVEEMDARCRAYHIAADTARAALPHLTVPLCSEDENGWELLQGSDEPRAFTPEEARRLLQESKR